MQLWTIEHALTLPAAMVVMLVIAIILRRTIGTKPLKIRIIPFQILAGIAFALEIGKQVISFARGYDLYHIPLHFCSLFIFMLPAMAFYTGKHRLKVSAITSALCSAVVLLMLIYPNLIYSAHDITNFFEDYMCMHTVTFHNIIIFEFILIVALGLHAPEKKRDVRAIIIFIICFCMVAGSMAQILKTNFANYYSCNIPPLENLRIAVRDAVGIVPAQILYVLIVSLLHVAFVYLSYWLYRLLRRIFSKNFNAGEEKA